jgi:hypothetical protein
MPSNRAELTALKNLISQAQWTLASDPELPEHPIAACRELLGAAFTLADDLLKESRPTTAAVTLGRKGGSTTSRRHGPEHYRQMAANRKTFGGGRPKKKAE